MECGRGIFFPVGSSQALTGACQFAQQDHRLRSRSVKAYRGCLCLRYQAPAARKPTGLSSLSGPECEELDYA